MFASRLKDIEFPSPESDPQSPTYVPLVPWLNLVVLCVPQAEEHSPKRVVIVHFPPSVNSHTSLCLGDTRRHDASAAAAGPGGHIAAALQHPRSYQPAG